MTVQNPMMQLLVKLLSKNPGDSFAACRQARQALRQIRELAR